MPLGEQIRDARLAKQMTQDDLAQQLGVTQRSIGTWERDGALPKDQHLAMMRQVLEADLM